MTSCAIILAAGQGRRFNDQLPKQFHYIAGKPLIFYCLESFFNFNPKQKIILVLNKQWISYWNETCKTIHIEIPHQIIEGGKNRSESVCNAIDKVDDSSCVMIHDAARPCLSKNLIQSLYKHYLEKGNAVPSLPVTNSLRKITKGKSHWIDRNLYHSLQTPQVYKAMDLKKAFYKHKGIAFTDESEMMGKNNLEINLVNGDPDNIKITYPRDIQLASLILQD